MLGSLLYETIQLIQIWKTNLKTNIMMMISIWFNLALKCSFGLQTLEKIKENLQLFFCQFVKWKVEVCNNKSRSTNF